MSGTPDFPARACVWNSGGSSRGKLRESLWRYYTPPLITTYSPRSASALRPAWSVEKRMFSRNKPGGRNEHRDYKAVRNLPPDREIPREVCLGRLRAEALVVGWAKGGEGTSNIMWASRRKGIRGRAGRDGGRRSVLRRGTDSSAPRRRGSTSPSSTHPGQLFPFGPDQRRRHEGVIQTTQLCKTRGPQPEATVFARPLSRRHPQLRMRKLAG